VREYYFNHAPHTQPGKAGFLSNQKTEEKGTKKKDLKRGTGLTVSGGNCLMGKIWKGKDPLRDFIMGRGAS